MNMLDPDWGVDIFVEYFTDNEPDICGIDGGLTILS